jgi:glycosyltransferase involved in cell wall biosynthesis
MNILTVNFEYPPLGGGGGIFTRDLAEELAKEHTVDVITSGYKTLNRSENVNGVNIFRVPVMNRTSLPTSTLTSLLSFVPSCRLFGPGMLSGRKYDLVHTHFAVPSGPAGIFFSNRYGVPHILNIHGGDIYDPSKKTSPHRFLILRKTIRHVMEKATSVIAQSTDTRNRALSIYAPSKKISVIPLGIPEPPEKTATREELGLEAGATYMISVGRLIKRKGYGHLIEAFGLIKDEYPGLNLILVGDGPERGALEELAAAKGLSHRTVFAGQVDDKQKFALMSASDVYVLSSLHEGFGIVLLESLFYGLPIASTDEGGQTDIVKEGVNGLLCRPCDPVGLKNILSSILSDSELRDRFRRNNLKDFKKYHIPSIAGEYTRLFREILTG